MRIVTEGIVLKEVKLTDGRRIVTLLTQKLGKISAGTSINERGKTKSALALKPFTVAVYSIYKNGGYYTISQAEVKHAYYKTGEDIDRFLSASYILELTEKILAEGQKADSIYRLLLEFLEEIQDRKKKFDTLVIAYEVKILKMLGIIPLLDACGECGGKEKLEYISIEDGMILCDKCFEKYDPLKVSSDFIDVFKFFSVKPLKSLKSLALNETISNEMQDFIKKYISYHLDIGKLNSEPMMINNL